MFFCIATMKVLFICNANLQRSPTAEEIFKDEFETKSAGVHPEARVPVTKAALEWADMIFVMEAWHKQVIQEWFPDIKKRIIVLGIPDQYYNMEPELITLLRKKVKEYIH